MPVSFTPRHAHHALAAAALVLLSTGAGAQASATPGQLQTITVTAERRLENIRDVPSAISAPTLADSIPNLLSITDHLQYAKMYCLKDTTFSPRHQLICSTAPFCN